MPGLSLIKFGAQRSTIRKQWPIRSGQCAERALDFLDATDINDLIRLALPSRGNALGDLALTLKLKLQVLDQYGQTLSRKRIAGLQCQSTGLGQPSVEFFAVSAIHFHAPAK